MFLIKNPLTQNKLINLGIAAYEVQISSEI